MPPERDLFANFERMRREIDDRFGDVFARSGFGPGRAFTPEVDVYYCGQPPRAVVTAELAGVEGDEGSLEIRGRPLLLAGARRAPEPGAPPPTSAGERRARGGGARRDQQIEIAHGPVRRVVELGAEVEAERA